MLVSLIPLFDRDMNVKAYSVYAQKENQFLNPLAMMTSQNDGATNVPGLDIVRSMGIETISDECEIFVPISNVAIFADMDSQVGNVPHERIVFLLDNTIPPVQMYVDRIIELKKAGYKIAIHKVKVAEFMDYAPVLTHVDYVLLNNKKIVIEKAKIFFSKMYPMARLIAGNIETQEIFEGLRATGGYDLYEGEFYRVPIAKNTHEITPVKVTYLQLLKLVNSPDFELQEAADIIGRDPAITISLLKMVNRVVKTAQITTIRHAATMLGQRELKKWINTVVAEQLYSDKPGELTRVSLLRGRFAENLAKVFDLSMQSEELFLMGLFSCLDVILEKPMKEALAMIQVSKDISDALLYGEGKLAPVYNFMRLYEAADWSEVSRVLLLKELNFDDVSNAYVEALIWYRETIKN